MAAVKLALKVGPDNFYNTFALRIRRRTGMELPGETRGLLRPTKQMERFLDRLHRHRSGSRRHAHPIGLHGLHHRQRRRLSSASRPDARAAGPGRSRSLRGACTQARSLSRPAKICPIPLPPGAHRVISETDRRADAQDDGRRRPLWQRQAGAAQRLLIRRQNRHRAKG